jgi:hypothetical protein
LADFLEFFSVRFHQSRSIPDFSDAPDQFPILAMLPNVPDHSRLFPTIPDCSRHHSRSNPIKPDFGDTSDSHDFGDIFTDHLFFCSSTV